MARTKEIQKGRDTTKGIFSINCLPTAPQGTMDVKATSTKKIKGIPKRREQTLQPTRLERTLFLAIALPWRYQREVMKTRELEEEAIHN